MAKKGVLIMSKHKDGLIYLSTWDLIKLKFKKEKINKVSVANNSVPRPPNGSKINHIAIVLDDEVQEIMRAENRFTALLLSQPRFIEFDPESESVHIGDSVIDGKIVSIERNDGV
jgi:hypothetical protein